jgi:DNA gyrase subunit A
MASEHGYGKRTNLDEFPTYGRGSQGVIAMQCSDRNGNLVTALQLFDGDEMMLISDKGTLVRTRTDEVSVLSRNTQGVRLIKLSQEDERLVGVERIAETDAEDIAGEDVSAEDVSGESTEVEGVSGDGSDVQAGSETLDGNSTDADDNGDADAGDE